jgi:hypothetical protein
MYRFGIQVDFGGLKAASVEGTVISSARREVIQ